MPSPHPPRAVFLLAPLLWSWGCTSEYVVGGPPAPTPDAAVGEALDLFGIGPSDLANPQPTLGAVVEQQQAPPAISGGTLMVTRDGRHAVASDPDRDRLYVVELDGPRSQMRVKASLVLAAGDEPGRVVEDGAGRAHVVLRRGGALLTVDIARGVIVERRPVCAIPRGLAWDEERDQLWLACMGGELLGLRPDGGAPTVRHQLERDLRDVVPGGEGLYVTRFRSAEVLVVTPRDGRVVERRSPAALRSWTGSRFTPAVAWRMVGDGDGGGLLVHQAALEDPVKVERARAWPTPLSCADGLESTMVSDAQGRQLAAFPGGALPVDVARAEDGRLAIAFAGRRDPAMGPSASVFRPQPPAITCGGDRRQDYAAGDQVTAVAFLPSGELLMQAREPAVLTLGREGRLVARLGLDLESRRDTGHDILHLATAAGIACASCHPEGGEDGRTWRFDNVGERRTMTLRGGVPDRSPFHWTGEHGSLEGLLTTTFEARMSGPPLHPLQVRAAVRYLGALPDLPAPQVDKVAAARGRDLFERAVGPWGSETCATCHRGPQLAGSTISNVGTGGPFKAPTLRGLAWRAPFLHDGSARDLAAAIAVTPQHALTTFSHPTELLEVIAYLESL